MTNLEELYMNGALLSDYSVLDQLCALKKLKRLDLSDCKNLNDITFSGISQMISLEELNLMGGFFPGNMLCKLAILKNLKVLKMSRIDEMTINDYLGISQITSLKVLYLTGCHLPPRGFRNFPNLKKLEELRLSINTGFNVNDIIELSKITSLKDLSIINTHKELPGLLKHLSSLQKLETLRIHNYERIPLQDFNRLFQTTNLEEFLQPRRTLMSGLLENLGTLKTLKKIEISSLSIPLNMSLNAKDFIGLSQMSGLEELSLKSIKLESGQMKNLVLCKRLKELCLTSVKGLSSEDIYYISKLENLEVLVLDHCEPHSGVLSQLKSLKKLRRLTFAKPCYNDDEKKIITDMKNSGILVRTK